MTRPRLVIVKLGGAAITEKHKEETLCTKGLAAAAAAIGAAFGENGDGAASTRFIVVHGAGSFGHQAAAREGFSSSSGTGDISPESNAGDPQKCAAAVARVRASCGRLHSAVVSSLVAAGVPALSHPPAPAGWCTAGNGQEVVDHSCGMLAGLLDLVRKNERERDFIDFFPFFLFLSLLNFSFSLFQSFYKTPNPNREPAPSSTATWSATMTRRGDSRSSRATPSWRRSPSSSAAG